MLVEDRRPLSEHDLSGCRYAVRQRDRFPLAMPTEQAVRRRLRAGAVRRDIVALLPTAASKGEGKVFSRVDVEPEVHHYVPRVNHETALPLTGSADWPQFRDPAVVESFEDMWFFGEMLTLEAMANDVTLITGTRLSGVVSGRPMRVGVDALVKHGNGYAPVFISQHRVARPDERHTVPLIHTGRLGLGTPVRGKWRLKHHAMDGYRIALATELLAQLGARPTVAYVIGQDRERAFIVETSRYERSFQQALRVPVPETPRKVKQCATCRFWFDCQATLQAADDISLVLPGQAAQPFRDRGITTVEALAATDTPGGRLARAHQRGIAAFKRRGYTPPSGADVEIFVDVESYLDRGAYLWGVLDDSGYTAHVTFDGIGGNAEADMFAHMWRHLMTRINAAEANNQQVAVYCYAQGGEKHWLLDQATRFAGHVTADGAIAPTPDEVADFLSSAQWRDVFENVRKLLASPEGLGLKPIAALAGYQWPVADIDGEVSLHYYRIARGFITDPQLTAEQAREHLIAYNRGDVEATRRVHEWLKDNAPGVLEAHDI